MGVASVLGGSAVLGAGASIFGASQAANATKQAAAQQQAYAQQAYGQNQDVISGLGEALAGTQGDISDYLTSAKGSISDAFKQSNNIISRIPSVTAEYPAAQNLSQLDFNYRDAIKKQNLDFVLGSTQEGLRTAQTLNTSLANLDPSGFNTQVNRILNSANSNLKAMTVGEPTGSFANLSAQNLQSFSQQGLSNELAISDFFSKNGTVDPVSPAQLAFNLQGVDQSIAQLGIQNSQWQGQNLANIDITGAGTAQNLFGDQAQVAGLSIQSNNQLASLLSNSAGASALGQAQLAQSIAPAIGSITQGLSAGYGISLQQSALANQQSFQSSFLNQLKAQQINGNISQFAPASTASYALPSINSSNPTGLYNAANFQANNVASLDYGNLALPVSGVAGTVGSTGGFIGTNALFGF